MSKPTLKTQSGALYRPHLGKLQIPEFGTKRVDQIVLEHIEGRSASEGHSCQSPLAEVREQHRWHAAPGCCTKPTSTGCPLRADAEEGTGPEEHPCFFGFETAELVLEAAETWDEEPLVPFLMRTGLRIGEALGAGELGFENGNKSKRPK